MPDIEKSSRQRAVDAYASAFERLDTNDQKIADAINRISLLIAEFHEEGDRFDVGVNKVYETNAFREAVKGIMKGAAMDGFSEALIQVRAVVGPSENLMVDDIFRKVEEAETFHH